MHKLKNHGVSVADVKVSAVCNCLVTKAVQNIQGFFSLANFLKLFITLFTNISAPLASLMKKGHLIE